jgi:hypothetical protein
MQILFVWDNLQRWCGINFANYTPRKIECNRFVNENRPSHDGLAKEEERERAFTFSLQTNSSEDISNRRRVPVVEAGMQ